MRPGARQKWTWRFTDSDPHCLSRARRLSDHDLHIETNGRHQVHQPLRRKPAQPVLPKCQQAGLRDAERLGSGGPREPWLPVPDSAGRRGEAPVRRPPASGDPRSANTRSVPPARALAREPRLETGVASTEGRARRRDAGGHGDERVRTGAVAPHAMESARWSQSQARRSDARFRSSM